MAILPTLPVSIFASIVDALSYAVAIVDSDDRILYWNNSAVNTFGYTQEEILGQPISNVVLMERPSGGTIEHFYDFKGEIETHGVSKDLRRVPIHVSFMALDATRSRTALVIRDITDIKLSESRLNRSQQLGTVGTWESDTQSGRIYCSDEMFRICGIEPKEHFTMTEYLTNYVHPDDVEQVRQAMNMAVGDVYDLQYRVVRPGGEVRWVHVQGYYESSGDLPLSRFGSVKDITLFKQSVEDLTRSKDNLELANKLAKLGHWEWDIRNNDILWSNETYSIVGQKRSGFERTYQAYLTIVHPDDREFVHDAVCLALTGEELDVEYRIVRPDGEDCVVHVVGKAYSDESGEPIRLFGTCQDITHKRKTEEMLIRSEKLAVVGQLAAGFAHEIRNPLTALKGFTQLLQRKADGEDKRYCAIMMKELGHIATIVDELLVFAKPQAYIPRPIVIESLVEDVIELLRPQATLNNCEIRTNFTGLTWTNCEPNQLKQVFVNVIKNAIEAMPNGGGLSISLHRMDDRMQIEFADEGIGVPQAVMSKLGEPFYTTKHGGTGLGLMVSQKIINTHKGTMHISSQVGVGTIVSIELPVDVS